MTTRYPIAVFSVLALLALLPPQRGSAAEPGQGSEHWSEKMRSLYRTLSSLMTDVSSDERFKNPKYRPELLNNAKKLADLAHDLKSGKTSSPDKDPSIAIFANLFAEETKQAYRSLKSGNEAYGRDLLRAIPGYCIACHTRNKTGPDFASLPLEPSIKNLRGVELGEFFASTRQYDRALGEFERVIGDAKVAKSEPIEWSHAVKYALAVAVRAKQDPKKAREIVEKVIKSEHAPFFMREDAVHWLQSIDEWSKEPKRETTTEEGLYSEAVRLLGKAHEAQKYPADHSADVLYLRASAATHDLLQLGAGARHAGEAYLMAGICYEVLSSFHIGELQEIYYEACVRTNPHTTIASACYRRYQESILNGYTGSSGTHLPEDERIKLKELEDMARIPTNPEVRVN